MANNEAKWYVAHTFSGYENKVASDITTIVENHNDRYGKQILKVAIPTEMVKEVKSDGSSKEKEKKIFPGYVFVKMIMNDDTWYVIRNVRGCTGFVGPDSNPVPLSKAEIKKFNLDTDEEEKKEPSVKLSYAVGDKVNIIDGPLEGYFGTVQNIDLDEKSVEVTVSMFGRDTNVEFEFDQLQKADDDE